jgi:CHASE2 domain-containing sensor protein
MSSLVSPWLVFAAAMIGLLVSTRKKRLRRILFVLSAVSFCFAAYFTLRTMVNKSVPLRPPALSSQVVHQETTGNQSPAVQGVTGDVKITNEQNSRGKNR